MQSLQCLCQMEWSRPKCMVIPIKDNGKVHRFRVNCEEKKSMKRLNKLVFFSKNRFRNEVQSQKLTIILKIEKRVELSCCLSPGRTWVEAGGDEGTENSQYSWSYSTGCISLAGPVAWWIERNIVRILFLSICGNCRVNILDRCRVGEIIPDMNSLERSAMDAAFLSIFLWWSSKQERLPMQKVQLPRSLKNMHLCDDVAPLRRKECVQIPSMIGIGNLKPHEQRTQRS